MKKFITTSILLAMFTACTTVMAQTQKEEYLGLPGDNLNLYAVMNLFQKSATLEDFERNLNDENSRINNLDLNGDNLIDYITVTDNVDGDVHTIVLQDAINRNERQDVAVFTVQRFRNGSVQIQLIGDEALYGRNYIIEPIYDDIAGETPNPGYDGRTGNGDNITVVRTTPVEIAAWPMIRFIYRPNYTIWHSSWHWGYYPSYWHPWNSFSWHYYSGYQHNWYPDYYMHYRHWEHPRYTRYNDFYYSNIRSHSPQVNMRIKEGNYKNTYSHPEQRRDGEVLYTKLHSDRSSTVTNNRGNNEGRRSGSKSGGRESTTPGNRTGTTGRSTTTTERTNINRSSGQRTNGSRKSSATVTERSGQNPSSGQNAGNSRRSSSATSDRAASKPQPVQKKENVRSSGKSTSSVSSSNRRSKRDSKSGTADKKSEKSNQSDNSKSSRRK